MSRKLFVVLVAMIAAVAFAATVFAAAPAGDVKVKNAKGAGTKGEVTLSHAKHAADKCVDCHHEAKTPEAEAAIKACSTCHGVDAKATGDVMSKKKDNPYHKNCVDQCHKAKGKGPTKCKECHGGGDE